MLWVYSLEIFKDLALPSLSYGRKIPASLEASSGLKVIKLFSCSTQLSMKFSLLVKLKMPTIVDIFIFISREILMLSCVWQERI